MCGPRDESITHFISESTKLAQKRIPKIGPKRLQTCQHYRNEMIQLCQKLCQKFNINLTPENVVENETVPKRAKLIMSFNTVT